MYHGRFNKSHYETGYNWGKLLYKNGKKIDQTPTFRITEERKKHLQEIVCLFTKDTIQKF